jgi:hypothetical protein
MKVILSGGEKGTFRNILVANGVSDIALNLTQYNIPKTKEVDLNHLFKGADVYIYTSDGDEDIEKFDSFVREHADSITGVIGRHDYNGDWLGEKYIPLWNDEHDVERLAYLCQKYGRAAVSDRAINTKTLPRIRQLQQRWGAKLYGITSKVDHIESADWDAVLVSSWTSVVRYGETQIWDGHGLRRYPAQKKVTARKKHRSDIIRLGIDYEAIEQDDVSEVAKLAVKSWLAWANQSVGSGVYHPVSDDDEAEFQTPDMGGIATIPPETVTSPKPVSNHPAIATDTPMTRHESEQQLLPVIGFEKVVTNPSFTTPDGEEVVETTDTEVDVITHEGSGIRSCDSCYLASRCPAFKEHSECGYRIPVRIHTKQQLQAVLTAMLEMQTSRVLFARFAEELEGQGMDPAVSAEMDRLFKLVKEFKDIEDTRDLVRVQVEARGSSGVLSRIFGQKAADKANELPQPLEASDVDDLIINADLVDEE